MARLFINGNIHTMEKNRQTAEAFIVDGDSFVFVGDKEGANAFINENYEGQAFEATDLAGRLVIPGLIDSHMHFIPYAQSIKSAILSGSKSVEEIKERMKAHLKSNPPKEGAWLQGEGWNNDYFEGENRFPDKHDLDEVSTDMPVITFRACIHIASLNTRALELLNINRETAPAYGDLVDLMDNGDPSGIIKENLIELAIKAKNAYSLESLKDLILSTQNDFAEQGLTSIHSDDIAALPGHDYELLIRAFHELDQEGRLKVRISQQCRFENIDQMKEFMAKYPPGWGNKFRLTSIKSFTDGSLGARTALLREPYADDPSTRGIQMISQEDLDELVYLADSQGYPVAVHAIGDKAIEIVLNAVEKTRKATGNSSIRHGIVHCQITDEALLERIKDLELITYIQPIFIDYDMNIVESRVGPDLAKTSYAWKTMVTKGIHASFGSDCPVESFRTMDTIFTAVSQKNISGKEKRVFHEDQRLTMDQALYCYTMEGAYASSEENIKGSISPGKLADFIVLDTDIFTIKDQEDILKTKVSQTYLSGDLIFER